MSYVLDAVARHAGRTRARRAARAAADEGRALYFQRVGQLNLSCAQCHDRNWGRRLAGAPIPQGHANAYPIYRLEWQSVGLQRRLRNWHERRARRCAAVRCTGAGAAGGRSRLRAAGMPLENTGRSPVADNTAVPGRSLRRHRRLNEADAPVPRKARRIAARDAAAPVDADGGRRCTSRRRPARRRASHTCPACRGSASRSTASRDTAGRDTAGRDIARGRDDGARLAATCTGCHGTDGKTVGDALPALAGQSEQALLASLMAFKLRRRSATVMTQLAQGLQRPGSREHWPLSSRRRRPPPLSISWDRRPRREHRPQPRSSAGS